MRYWVYENYPTNKAMVHEDSCGFCNYGGRVRGGSLDNGRWHGPSNPLRSIRQSRGHRTLRCSRMQILRTRRAKLARIHILIPPLSPRLCVTTHPAPVLKFSARVNA